MLLLFLFMLFLGFKILFFFYCSLCSLPSWFSTSSYFSSSVCCPHSFFTFLYLIFNFKINECNAGKNIFININRRVTRLCQQVADIMMFTQNKNHILSSSRALHVLGLLLVVAIFRLFAAVVTTISSNYSHHPSH